MDHYDNHSRHSVGIRVLLKSPGFLIASVVSLALGIGANTTICANIANLMMARATARRREITVRLALGGARSRIVSQLLIESILVALPGGVLAVLVAVGGRNLILSLLPSFAGAQNVSMPLDTTVLGFTLSHRQTLQVFRRPGISTVIGLAANTKVVFVGEAPQAMAFLPLEQDYQPVMTLHVRTSGRPETLKGTIEREVQSLDRHVALTQVLTAPEWLALSLWGPRMAATLLSIFGIVALILAAVGIYGVMSYSVNQRASEIGIRMALGAERSDVLRMVLRQRMTVVSIGLAAGLVVATIISSVLKSLLYGVGMLDIPTFAATAAVLFLVALVANYVPARRATKVDPVHVMRYE